MLDPKNVLHGDEWPHLFCGEETAATTNVTSPVVQATTRLAVPLAWCAYPLDGGEIYVKVDDQAKQHEVRERDQDVHHAEVNLAGLHTVLHVVLVLRPIPPPGFFVDNLAFDTGTPRNVTAC